MRIKIGINKKGDYFNYKKNMFLVDFPFLIYAILSWQNMSIFIWNMVLKIKAEGNKNKKSQWFELNIKMLSL